MYLGPSLSIFPSGFQVSARLMMQFDDFINVCAVYFQRPSPISSSTETWFFLPHSRLLLMVFGQRTWSILHRQLFINTCTLFIMVVVVLHNSAPYSKTNCLEVRIKNRDLDVGLQTVVLSPICSSTEGMLFLFCQS